MKSSGDARTARCVELPESVDIGMEEKGESQDEKRHEEDIKHHPYGKEAELERDSRERDSKGENN